MATKWMWIIAGPPGSGKSSLGAQLFPDWLGTTRHIDADKLSVMDADDVPMSGLSRHGAPVSKRLQIVEAGGRDFVVETRLVSNKVMNAATRLRARGWKIVLIYLALPQNELCRRRIRARVDIGGEDITDAALERGFQAAHENLGKYLDIADRWLLLDGTGRRAPRIAQGRGKTAAAFQADILRALLPDRHFIPGARKAPWAETVEAEFIKISRWHQTLSRMMALADRIEANRP